MELGEARRAIDGATSVDELFGVLRGLRDESGLAHLVYHATFVPAFDKANALLMPTYDEAFVCGPEPMTITLRETLLDARTWLARQELARERSR